MALIFNPPLFAHSGGVVTDAYGNAVRTPDGGCLLFGNPAPNACQDFLNSQKKPQAKTTVTEEKTIVPVKPVPKPVTTQVPAKPEPVPEPRATKKDKKPVMQKIISLSGVSFLSNSDKLNPSSFEPLDRSIQQLKQNPAIKVIVAGHTDNRGDAEFNKALSIKRAESVRKYLVINGIEAARLSTKGYGDTEPAASNDTPIGRALNRRVELRIIQ